MSCYSECTAVAPPENCILNPNFEMAVYYSYSVYCLLEFIEEEGGMSAVHLNMVELEGDGQGCPQPALAVVAPHHHRITELVGILIDDAVEFRLCHC